MIACFVIPSLMSCFELIQVGQTDVPVINGEKGFPHFGQALVLLFTYILIVLFFFEPPEVLIVEVLSAEGFSSIILFTFIAGHVIYAASANRIQSRTLKPVIADLN